MAPWIEDAHVLLFTLRLRINKLRETTRLTNKRGVSEDAMLYKLENLKSFIGHMFGDFFSA